MEPYIKKADIVAEIERRISVLKANESVISMLAGGMFVNEFKDLLSFLDTLEVKEIDIDKLCEFRKNIGFAYPESASEYQKQLACYRQGIKDVIKAQKGE